MKPLMTLMLSLAGGLPVLAGSLLDVTFQSGVADASIYGAKRSARSHE